MKSISSISTLLFFIVLAGGFGVEYITYGNNPEGLWVLGVAFLVAIYFSSAVKIADQ